MLVQLRVKNFLLLRDAHLTFAPGLNVLTGETGTGKSILLDALGLTLGLRGSSGWIGAGGGKLRIEAEFRADRPTMRLASGMGIPIEGDRLILVREIPAGGKGRCFANGQRVLQRSLRRLGAHLVEVHGQRQEERFRLPEVQRDLLDLFGGHGDLRQQMRDRFREAQAGQRRLADHARRLARLRDEEDWIRFQLAEIDELSPGVGEAEELAGRLRDLRSAQTRTEWLALAEQLLNGREGAVLESLETLDARASTLAPEDETYRDIRERVKAARAEARGLYREVERQLDRGASECAELPALEERLSRLERLQRKHRKPLAEILTAAEEMRASLHELEQGAEEERALKDALTAACREAEETAIALGQAREEAGQKLARAVERELAHLKMKGCSFGIALEALDPGREAWLRIGEDRAIGPTGAERVQFEVETNPGTGLRPLGEIASGGEMARVALALRVILGRRGRRGLAVFDEIDAGLGATAARAVATRLRRVARHRQVLLVTHLPVIAASAERHFRVWKGGRGATTVARATEVAGGDRVGEIARMLSGDARDERACRHAEALLSGA